MSGVMLLQPLTLNVGSQAASSAPSPVLNEASVSQSDQQVPSTSPESKLETSSEASTSSNQMIASNASAASASQPIASDTTHEALTDQADDAATSKRRQKRAAPVPSSSQSSPFLVGTAQELAAAIKRGETHIRLTADINIGDAAIPVRQSVTIDGDHKYTYMYNSGLDWHRGIYFAASGIQITFKNIKIGKASVKHSANNYYGIAPADNSIRNSQIIIENVDYYSDYGAQPLHIRDKSNQIIFRGKNSFYTTKNPGSFFIQEFAEATNFLFEEDSDTTITLAKGEVLGTFWPSTGPLNLELKKRARLKVDTTNALVYTGIGAIHNNRIVIGEEAVLDVKTSRAVAGNLMFYNHDLTIDVQRNGQLLAETVSATNFNSNSSINLGPGAKANLKNVNGDFFKKGKGTITLDNADELILETGKFGGTSPTGLVSSQANVLLEPFNQETKGYEVHADGQLLTTQTGDDDWIFNGKYVSRQPTALPTDVAKQVGNASVFKLKRQVVPKPAGKLAVISVPDLDFGNQTVTGLTQILRPRVQGSLKIEDSRTNGSRKSRLYLRMARPFKNGDVDATRCLTYTNQAGQEQTLSSQAILAEVNVGVTERDVSSEWNTAIDSSARGFKLTLPIEKQKIGNFSGELDWSLQDVPGN
ncbi:pectate lyase-like adhesive domain-containing protein [Lacticaseibacillus zeae]|uniref:pectate lyase-like adhesive domain-containing protein n=1 Tax=Lacticaseibacillus zeae TaxID=57037 RepID=UPI00279523E3|nr:pectate lyase-like adhesive domain-containing protein [Lacticaseibacillus sp. NCIMB 15474]WLV86604.1 cell surface complex protein [Lacticaseibacillus sp. NCIMB 15474]